MVGQIFRFWKGNRHENYVKKIQRIAACCIIYLYEHSFIICICGRNSKSKRNKSSFSNSNEIKNRLSESYTLDEVDEVCEDLQDYSINISKLPFQVNKPGSMRARLREDRSKDPLKDMDSQYDDTVDDYLLDLAGLRK